MNTFKAYLKLVLNSEDLFHIKLVFRWSHMISIISNIIIANNYIIMLATEAYWSLSGRMEYKFKTN